MKKITQNSLTALVSSVFSMVIDLFVICASIFLVLFTIQVLPQDYLSCIFILLLGALPASLGSIVLTTLTSETLKKRAKELYKEYQDIIKQIDELEKEREERLKSLKKFEKEKKEFEEFLEDHKLGGDKSDER